MRDARAAPNSYDDVLWLFGKDRQITEVGSSNFVTELVATDSKLSLSSRTCCQHVNIPSGNECLLANIAAPAFVSAAEEKELRRHVK